MREIREHGRRWPWEFGNLRPQNWRLFEQICVDTKYLCDIPQYWPQMTGMDLPRFQYTARDVTSGLVFVAYADEISKTYATLFSAVISEHLRSCLEQDNPVLAPFQSHSSQSRQGMANSRPDR